MFRQNQWFREGALTGALSLLLLVAIGPDAAVAQRHGGHVHDQGDFDDDEYLDHDQDRSRSRWELGGGLAVLVPQGDFSTFVDDGYGLTLNATVGLGPSNVLGLRFEAGFVNYGSERFGVPVFPGTGRILTDLTTHNNIGFLGLGPQLQVPSGPFRPYVNAFMGVSYFFTESSVRGGYSYDYRGFGSTLNFDDASLAYGVGGGLGLRLGSGRIPVFLKLDAQYRRHGETEYLIPGSIVDDGFGGAFITPLISDVDFVLVQVGLSISL